MSIDHFDEDVPDAEISTAERYGVKSFDLKKKQTIIDASRKYMPTTPAGVMAFGPAMNELHFDGDTGRLVSLEQARELAQVCDEAAQLFEQFLAENQNIL